MVCFYVALLYANKGLKIHFLMLHIIMYTIFSNIYKKRQKQEIILHDAGHYM